MSLSPLRQPAAPTQDAPRKPGATTLQQPARPANRPSNPALQSVRAGESGFDGRPQLGSRPQLADSRPQFMPAAPAGAGAASGIQGVGGPQAAIERLFQRASRTL